MAKNSRKPGSKQQQRLVDWADKLIEIDGHHRILGILARYSDKHGLSFPSMTTLAVRAGVTPRQARRAVARLERDGLVLRVARKAGPLQYRTSLYLLVGAPTAHWSLSKWADHIRAEVGRRSTGRHPRPGRWVEQGEMTQNQQHLRDLRRWGVFPKKQAAPQRNVLEDTPRTSTPGWSPMKVLLGTW